MSKAYPQMIFAAWCWCAGWARSASEADWCAERGIGKVRAAVIGRGALVGMTLLAPLWGWVRR